MRNNILVILGGVLGGVAGFFLFGWVLRQGLVALIVPGGFVGLGAGIFKGRSRAVPAVCCVLALVAGILAEWHFMPFEVDESLGYFLSHLTSLPPTYLAMMALGTGIGFWVPFRRAQDARKTA